SRHWEFFLTDLNMKIAPRGKIYSINECYQLSRLNLESRSTPNGKLRVLYECFPMAQIFQNAGGFATDVHQNILDIVPAGLHVRSPIFMGS
ncbi:Fructose-1_6-bisphosphatase 1, partial [Caligus rogercresseyi]